MLRRGTREGRNQAGEKYTDFWNVDSQEESWVKETLKYSGEDWYKWGEGQTCSSSKLVKKRWQEKLEKADDYWEKIYEEEAEHL